MPFKNHSSLTNQNSSLLFIIDRFQNQSVILKTKTGQELAWPKEKLPGHYKIGDQIELSIKTNNESDSQYPAMRKLLEELIN